MPLPGIPRSFLAPVAGVRPRVTARRLRLAMQILRRRRKVRAGLRWAPSGVAALNRRRFKGIPQERVPIQRGGMVS